MVTHTPKLRQRKTDLKKCKATRTSDDTDKMKEISYKMYGRWALGILVSLMILGLMGGINWLLKQSKTTRYVSIQEKIWYDGILSKELIQQREPILLRNSPTTRWQASKKWTLEYLQTQIKGKHPVKMRDPPLFVHYDSQIELAKDYPPTFDVKHWSLDELFAQMTEEINGSAEINTGYYLNDRIEALSKNIVGDVEPTQPFLVNERPKTKIGSKLDTIQKTIKVWIGGGRRGVVANAHYDANHNIFHQVRGRKRFLLLPPNAWPHMYMYSRLHPSHRQSQIDLSQPLQDILLQFPNFAKVSAIYDVTLEEGDTMYLPPFWFHSVNSLGIAVSVNIWSNCRELNDFQYALANPIPYQSDLEQQGVIFDMNSNLLVLQLFFRGLIRAIYGEDINAFITTLVDSQERYAVHKHSFFDCGMSSNGTLILKIEHSLSPYIERLRASSFSRCSASICTSLLASFLEHLSVQFIRPDGVLAFLKYCISPSSEQK